MKSPAIIFTLRRASSFFSIFLISFVVLTLFSNQSHAQLAGYSFRKLITIDNTKVAGPSDHTDFPILVSVTDTDLRTTANNGDVTNTNGYDIVFTSSDRTTLLDFDVEKYDATTGEYIAWVRIPTLDYNDDTDIYMYYGNTAVVTDQSTTNTWNAAFQGVWHLNNDPNGDAANSVKDATANVNHGTPDGSMTTADLVTGKIGQSLNFDGSDDLIDINNPITTVVTVSSWIRHAGMSGVIERYVSLDNDVVIRHDGINGSGQLDFYIRNSGTSYHLRSDDDVLSDGQWYHVAGTFDGTTQRLFLDGVELKSQTPGVPIGSIGSSNHIGHPSEVMNGEIDEVRLSNVARSGDWIATEFNNQNNPSTFYSLGPEIAIAAPGNVSSNLILWLKADAGTNTSTDGGAVSLWTDQSGQSYHASGAGTAGYQADFTNFNPAISFTNDAKPLSNTNIARINGTASTIIVVGEIPVVNDKALLEIGDGPSPAPGRQFFIDQRYAAGGTPYALQTNEPSIWTVSDPGGLTTEAIYENGLNSFSSKTTNTDWTTGGSYFLGDDFTGGNALTGEIAEVIYYDQLLTTIEQRRVESYLAIKYGISRDISAGNYIASDGTSNLWDASANSAYHNNIAGIGRDDNTGLDQQKSISSNSGAMVIMDKGTTFASDLNFILWGNDAGLTTLTATDKHPDYDNIMTRKWKSAVNGMPGTVTLRMIYANSGIVGNYAIHVDADGTFSDGNAINYPASSISGDTITFANLSITDDDFFTLGVTQRGPGGVSGNLKLWLKANQGPSATTNNAPVNQWQDQSSTGNNATTESASREPTFKDNLSDNINFNPALEFDDIDDRMMMDLDVIKDGSEYSLLVVGQRHSTDPNYAVGSTANGTDNHALHLGYPTSTTAILGQGNNDRLKSVVAFSSPDPPYLLFGGMNSSGHFLREIRDDRFGHSQNFETTGLSGSVQDWIGYFYTGSADEYYDGLISEVIAYNSELTLDEEQRIHTYLAIKYGFWLYDDKVASDGTLLWDHSANIVYVYNAAGIGRDDASALDQRKSINNSQEGMVIMDKGAAFDSDLDFILWGNNNLAASLTGTSTHPDYDNIMTRQWKAAVNGTPGTAELRMIFPANTGVFGNYAIHVDPDGTFTDGNATNFPASSISGDTITFLNVSLADGDFFTLGEVQRAPGNVSDQIVLWLKADGGAEEAVGDPTEDGDAVEFWVDQSGARTNDATKSTGTSQPTYRSNATNNINNNPVVEFDGTDDGLNFGNDYIYSTGTGSEDGMTFFAVVKPDLTNTNPAKSEQYVFDFGAHNYNGYAGQISDDRIRLYGPTAPQSFIAGFNGYGPDNTIPVLVRFTFDFGPTSHQTIHIDGETTATTDDANTTTFLTAANISENPTHISVNGPFTIGRQSKSGNIGSNSGRYMQGDLAELIGYKKDITASEYVKIESYLAIKYGISIDNTGGGVGGDYQASDATLLWDASANATYHNDVTGIGRDDKSTLAQQKSMSINPDAMVLMDKGTTLASDLDFLLWGNNDASTATFSMLPDATNTYNVRMDRTWKTAVTGTPGSVTLQIIYPNTGVTTDYVLAVDADGDFTAGHVNYPVASISGDTLNFTNMTFSDGDFFSIGLSAVGPGFIAGDLRLWLKTDAGTAGSPTVTAWDDQSVNVNNTTASGDPQLVSNGINYNPAIDFDAVGDYFATTNTSLIGDNNPYTKFAVVISNISSGSIIIGSDASGDHDFRFASTPVVLRSRHGGSNFADSPQNYVTGQTHLTGMRYGGAGGLSDQISLDGRKSIDDTGYAFTDAGTIEIGTRDSGLEFWDGLIAEALLYDAEVTDSDLVRIESYLAVKYGITLDNTAGGTAGDYVATDGTTIWDADLASAYQNDVIAIGRDDQTLLYQKQSHSVDDTLNIYIDALAADNASNAGSITNDVSYLVIGHNGAGLEGQTTEMPGGIHSRFEREWKVTNTNFDDNFSLEFEWKEYGTFDINDIRLLVDSDGDFSNATTLGPADGLTFSVGSIIVGGITAGAGNHIPLGTSYITIASVSRSTPLPIELIDFSVTAVNASTIELDWQTASETNNDFFTIERSIDAQTWEAIFEVEGAGNSRVPLAYSVADKDPYHGISYYRLKQTDFDGQFEYSSARVVNNTYLESAQLKIYPNPGNSLITVEGSLSELEEIVVYNVFGQDVSASIRVTSRGNTSITMDISNLPDGLYTLKTKNNAQKIIKQ